jgi:aminoglycoside phosphotransferase family enzyme/predicted kinase
MQKSNSFHESVIYFHKGSVFFYNRGMAAKKRSGKMPPLVGAMLSREFYPHRPRKVELRQTHISWVFLAGDLVYKVKKPVDFGFLDYSTVRKRAYWCRREVELNRRLAPSVYVGVARITRRGGGYALGGSGAAADYAVVMRRLPGECLLSSRLAAGAATLADIRRVARRVARFHSRIPPAAKRNARLSVLRRNLEENFRQTEPFIGRTVSAGDYEEVWRYNRLFLEDRRFLLKKRIADGRVRDCHGDLHAEHICLGKQVTIIDCIEFSSRLRQTDTAAEVAFLYMDLLYHGHPHLARSFAETSISLSRDWEMRLLLSFYACYRAVVREKVESLRFADRHVPEQIKRAARRRAARYFHLARDLARRDGRPRLYLIGGLPGTGKSTLAAAWSHRLGITDLRSDVLRKELTGTALFSGRGAAGDAIYSREIDRRTYRELMNRAGPLLRGGHSVVLDATFLKRWQRSLASKLAADTGALLVEAECRASAAAVRRRLAGRSRAGNDPSDADWPVYREKKRTADPFPARAVTVRSDRIEGSLAAIAAAAYPL